jgi:hypothetical protein
MTKEDFESQLAKSDQHWQKLCYVVGVASFVVGGIFGVFVGLMLGY